MNKDIQKRKEVTHMGNKILVGILILVVAAGGFFGGMKYQESKSPAAGASGRAGGANGAFRQRGQNGQAVRGDVVSIDSGTMTIKMRDGSTKLVVLSGNTSITKSASGTQSDIKAGQQVMVFGSNNSDGSVTALMVQLNPTFRGPSGSPANNGTTNNTSNTSQ